MTKAFGHILRRIATPSSATTRLRAAPQKCLFHPQLGRSFSTLKKVCIINAGRVDFDRDLDYSDLAKVAEITRFEEDTPPEKFAERLVGQDIVITKEIPVPGSAIANFPDSVKMICEAGTGVNNIDHAAAAAKGITISNIPNYSSDSVAHMVITFMCTFSSSLVQHHRMLWEGDRTNHTEHLKLPHFEMNGKTLGLIGGSGDIGSKVKQVGEALGMKVIVSSRKPGSPTVEDLLKESDFVSIHCPLTETTKHLIDASKLKLMKPTAYIMNTARGPIIKEDDLLDALNNGTIAGAGLDVQEVEPPPTNSALYTHQKVLLTPHIGWKRKETRQRLVNMVAQNCTAFIQGKPINVVAAK